MDITQKQCTRCKKIKPVADFCKNRNKKSGFSSWCRKCIKNKHDKERGIKTEEEIEKEFEDILGGIIIKILNHPVGKEQRYNIISSQKGLIFQTDNKKDFINYLVEM